MPVVGMNIKTIDARKNQEITIAVKANTNTQFKEIKEEEIKQIGRKGLLIGFEFRTEYVADNSTKPLAEIKITGDVLFLDVNEHDKIMKEWKKDKKLPEDINLEIVNSVLRKCVVKALNISEDLQLPPPIGLPFASKKEEKQGSSSYIG